MCVSKMRGVPSTPAAAGSLESPACGVPGGKAVRTLATNLWLSFIVDCRGASPLDMDKLPKSELDEHKISGNRTLFMRELCFTVVVKQNRKTTSDCTRTDHWP